MHQRAVLKSEGSEMDNKKCGPISYRWVEGSTNKNIPVSNFSLHSYIEFSETKTRKQNKTKSWRCSINCKEKPIDFFLFLPLLAESLLGK